MQLFTGLEEWGRARASGMLARVMPAPEASAVSVNAVLTEQPSSKVLLVGLYQKMGQFLCATPLVRALAAAWPNASFHFLGNPANAVVAKANPHLERVWIWNKSAFWEWPAQLSALKKEHFDLAIMLTTERPSATGVFIARATGAKWVAGFMPPVSGSWATNAASLCHVRIPSGAEKNEVKKYLTIARAFGVPAQGFRPELATAPVSSGKGGIGLFIGGKAEREDRLWPVSHFVQLANKLKEAGRHVTVISPPPPEHKRLEEFQKTLGWTCPEFQEASVLNVATFLRTLDLLVCPDGGIFHLAAAVGTPTLGLFFSTDPEVWRHDMPQAILDGRGKPSAELRPETVAAEALRFLKVPASQ